MGESICVRRNCPYLWKEDTDDFARCHYEQDGFPAPCEDDEYEEEVEEE